MIFLLAILALPIVVYRLVISIRSKKVTILTITLCQKTSWFSYYWWHATYWSRRGINGPAPRLFYGNWDGLDKMENPGVLQIAEWTKVSKKVDIQNTSGRFISKTTGKWLSAHLLQKYGKVYGMYEGTRKVLVVSDLDMLQQLFLKKFEYFYGRKVTLLQRIIERERQRDRKERQR